MHEIRNDNGHALGVVLFQLGGPDSLQAVEPFLFNLFSDPDIIDFPFARLARPTLARLIATRRAKHVQEHYARIGGRSPIGELTHRQAAALERELQKHLDARVLVAMRYWHPTTADTARRVQEAAFHRLVLVPLYPQYSKTTTGSSLNEWKRKYSFARANSTTVKIIREFYHHPLYLEALVEKINSGWRQFADGHPPAAANDASLVQLSPRTADLPGSRAPSGGLEAGREQKAKPAAREAQDTLETFRCGPPADVHLVFSAHGVPMSVIAQGDPYQGQVEATVELVMKRGGWPNPHRLCYQSRVGPGKWLQPSLHATLHELASVGASRVLVIPISFVSDHVETLHEIDIEARGLAEKLGVRQFAVMPALNDSPKFIQALADLVLSEIP